MTENPVTLFSDLKEQDSEKDNQNYRRNAG